MNAIPDYFVHPATRILTAEQLDAYGWQDVPAEPAPEPANDAADEPFFVGCVEAQQRGVIGPITLEVLLDADGNGIEIGPFRIGRREAVVLFRLLLVARGLLAHPERPLPRPERPLPRSESGRGIAGWDLARNPTGLASCPPWEGETLP